MAHTCKFQHLEGRSRRPAWAMWDPHLSQSISKQTQWQRADSIDPSRACHLLGHLALFFLLQVCVGKHYHPGRVCHWGWSQPLSGSSSAPYTCSNPKRTCHRMAVTGDQPEPGRPCWTCAEPFWWVHRARAVEQQRWWQQWGRSCWHFLVGPPKLFF